MPTLAWTEVTLFGKLAGRLLNPGEIKKQGLLALPPPRLPYLKPTLRSPGFQNPRSPWGALPCLVLLLIQLGAAEPSALAAPAFLEDLRYQMEVLFWLDAARVESP